MPLSVVFVKSASFLAQVLTTCGAIDPITHFEQKIVIIFLPISLNMCFGAQKNRLIEMVLLSTYNICFG